VAQNQLTYDPTSLDFGSVGLGGSSTLTILFTNLQDPDAGDNVTVAVPDAVFTLASGDASFNLPSNGSTRTVYVTYTPTAVGDDSGNLTITHDSGGSPATPFTIAMAAACHSPVYTLPQIENNPAGVMKIDLIVDPSLPLLTVPTSVKVINIGSLTELIDVQPGIVDVQNLEIELAEDYSTYTQGFWYNVIQGYPDVDVQFKFLLEEDGTDTFFFWGKVYREDIPWMEHYVASDESSMVRTVAVTLVSLVHSLKDATIGDAITEMLTHTQSVTLVGSTNALQLQQIFASIISVAFDQTYDANAVQVRGYDIRLDIGGGGGTVSPMDGWVTTKGFSGWRGYIEGSDSSFQNPHAWFNRYTNCYALVAALALNFGWVVRYYYGDTSGDYDAVTLSNNKHRFEFITRGSSFATKISPEKGITESVLKSDSLTRDANIIVKDVNQSAVDTKSDNVNTIAATVAFTTTHTLTRSDDGGSWIKEGWAVGMTGLIAGGTNDTATITVTSVNSTVMVVNETLSNASAETVDIAGTGEQGGTIEYDQTSGQAWFLDGKENEAKEAVVATISSAYPVTDPPPLATFDLEVVLELVRPPYWTSAYGVYVITAAAYRGIVYLISGSGICVNYRFIDFYDYQSESWQTGYRSMQSVVMLYYSRRFSAGRKVYERKYNGMKFSDGSTTSHANLKPMKLIDIDDGIASQTYYATEVHKNFSGNSSTVLWAQQ